MEIGIYANTHGQGYRDDTDMYLASSPFEEMRPVRTAQLAEQHGFHSVWYPDQVCMPIQSGSAHTANVSGQRAYQPHHNMLDMAVVMGAVAACTQRIKLGTSVLIAPYRHPLADARQFATIDLLSKGRLMLGVGSGWMKEEFAAVGQDHAVRNAQTDECLQIYKRSWTDERSNSMASITNSKTSPWTPSRYKSRTRRLSLPATRRSARAGRLNIVMASIRCSWIPIARPTVSRRCRM